jgi:hypothetical protein
MWFACRKVKFLNILSNVYFKEIDTRLIIMNIPTNFVRVSICNLAITKYFDVAKIWGYYQHVDMEVKLGVLITTFSEK